MTRWGRSAAASTTDRSTTDRSAPVLARRQGTARVGDLRLWAGVALLAVSVAAGAIALGGDDDTVTVWRATRDLSAGAAPDAVEAVSVGRVVAGEQYVRADEHLDGVLRWPVAAGELVPRAAVGAPGLDGTRRVTVPIDPLHAPVGLQAGDVVDVWSMPRAEDVGQTAAADAPVLVLASALVWSVTEDAIGIGGELGVVLDVQEDVVPSVVAATRRGVLDLVSVPVTSQGIAS